jgi:hypothetical protein
MSGSENIPSAGACGGAGERKGDAHFPHGSRAGGSGQSPPGGIKVNLYPLFNFLIHFLYSYSFSLFIFFVHFLCSFSLFIFIIIFFIHFPH